MCCTTHATRPRRCTWHYAVWGSSTPKPRARRHAASHNFCLVPWLGNDSLTTGTYFMRPGHKTLPSAVFTPAATVKCESPVLQGMSHWLRQLYDEVGACGAVVHCIALRSGTAGTQPFEWQALNASHILPHFLAVSNAPPHDSPHGLQADASARSAPSQASAAAAVAGPATAAAGITGLRVPAGGIVVKNVVWLSRRCVRRAGQTEQMSGGGSSKEHR